MHYYCFYKNNEKLYGNTVKSLSFRLSSKCLKKKCEVAKITKFPMRKNKHRYLCCIIKYNLLLYYYDCIYFFTVPYQYTYLNKNL